jgi:hypothetical protein
MTKEQYNFTILSRNGREWKHCGLIWQSSKRSLEPNPPTQHYDLTPMPTKPRKKLVVCPACRSDDIVEHEMSSQLENGKYYQGIWLECGECGIQGPKEAWRNSFIEAPRRKK